ncbi:MAG: DUF5615 family PIN-like protein [Magnetococcus sp. YQC-5]
MKIKLYENIPVLIAPFLESFGHDVDTIRDEGLLGANDSVVWEATCREKRFFITQDLDFSDDRKFPLGTHTGILLVRLANPSLPKLMQRLQEIISTNRIETGSGCFITVAEKKIRIRRPLNDI